MIIAQNGLHAKMEFCYRSTEKGQLNQTNEPWSERKCYLSCFEIFLEVLYEVHRSQHTSVKESRLYNCTEELNHMSL